MSNLATIPKLILSIFLDLVGMASYFLPFLGELSDVVWAPVSSIIICLMYRSYAFAGFGFAEELLPFTDIVPTATITWLYCKINKK